MGDNPVRSRQKLAVLCLLLASATAAIAQNPFVGNWKLNQQASDFTGATLQFRIGAADSIELAEDGTKYSFRLDGKNYRMASGDLAVWQQLDAGTWTTAYEKPDGTALSSDTWRLDPDGKTLTVTSTGTKPDGTRYTDTNVYTRTTGTAGLMGAWKGTEVELSAPNDFSIEPYGVGGILMKIPSLKWSCLAELDGKDAVPAGPTVPPGFTIAFVRTGPSSFRMARKINGNAYFSALFTVSDDGKTMTEIGNSVGDPQKKLVWEKE